MEPSPRFSAAAGVPTANVVFSVEHTTTALKPDKTPAEK
jgi:hypothetical protein